MGISFLMLSAFIILKYNDLVQNMQYFKLYLNRLGEFFLVYCSYNEIFTGKLILYWIYRQVYAIM